MKTRSKNQAGFTLPELLVVIFMSGLFVSLLMFFMISYWRYGLLLEADLDTLTTRLNAGDYLRDRLNPASGLIIQNSIPDPHPAAADTTLVPVNYWLPIHAIPATVPSGSAGSSTPLIYFKRPSVNTSGAVAMNGTQPYEDEFILYLNGTTKSLMSRTLANPDVVNNKLKTSCPASLATTSCPPDAVVAADISSVKTRYFSKTGNPINYTSSYDTSTNTYTGPDFPLVEVVEFTLSLTKKPYFQTSNATSNTTIIRVAIRS
ncbi:MAG TPA: prepilin-type N-terminal cleavage/methylation domain-containing protein [Candidatus Limnocylindrales bacterium]|nr:prepilin-type N-terminal cleavage/methylation domain-containing protein [Candidatus Limnocylindrales bacterium]